MVLEGKDAIQKQNHLYSVFQHDDQHVLEFKWKEQCKGLLWMQPISTLEKNL